MYTTYTWHTKYYKIGVYTGSVERERAKKCRALSTFQSPSLNGALAQSLTLRSNNKQLRIHMRLCECTCRIVKSNFLVNN